MTAPNPLDQLSIEELDDLVTSTSEQSQTLAFLESPSAPTATTSSTSSLQTQPLDLEHLARLSPTLERLPATQRPPETLACASCPAGVWMAFAKNDDLQAFCMVTRTISWSRSSAPAEEITMCDGRLQAQMAASRGG